jgi:hypothetical protein
VGLTGVPQPSLVHEHLARFAGEWTGDEELSASDWAPEGGTAVGTYRNSMVLDGTYTRKK